MDTSAFGKRGRSRRLRSPDDFADMAKAPLLREANPRAPRRYPSFHGTVKRRRSASFKVSRGHRGTGVDFVIDIDIKTGYKKAFKAGAAVLRLFDKYGVPYFVKFSGGTGPHFIVPAEAFPLDCGSFGEVSQRLLQFVIDKTGVPRIDTSFSSPSHFLRLPYSVHEGTGLVSIPLTKDTFYKFRPRMAEIPNVEVADKLYEITKQTTENLRNLIDEATKSSKESRRWFPFRR